MSKQHICSVCGAQNFHLYKKKYMICGNCDSIFPYETYNNENYQLNHNKIDMLYKYVVEINTYLDNNEYNGTGIILSKNGTILTSYHVVFPENENPTSKKVIIVQKRERDKIYRTNIISYNKKQDIALLKIEENVVLNNIVFSKKEGKPAEKIYVIGNSKGEGLCVLDGIISDTNRKIDNLSYFMITAPVTNGCSGAPVFNSKGEILGIVSAGRDDISSMNYALPVENLIKFIKDNK